MSKQLRRVRLAAVVSAGPTQPAGDERDAAGTDLRALLQAVEVAERAELDFLLLAQSAPDSLTVLAALAAVTERIGLAGVIDPAGHEPYELARRLVSLDHLSDGRAGWQVELPPGARHRRAGSLLAATTRLAGAWPAGAIAADRQAGAFLLAPEAGRFAVRDDYFAIAGRFNVPRGPQGRPVLMVGCESAADLGIAAELADVIIVRQRAFEAARRLYADFRDQVVRAGRAPDEVLIMVTAAPSSSAELISDYVQGEAADGFVLGPQAGPAELAGLAAELARLGVRPAGYPGLTLREHLGLTAGLRKEWSLR